MCINIYVHIHVYMDMYKILHVKYVIYQNQPTYTYKSPFNFDFKNKNKRF